MRNILLITVFLVAFTSPCFAYTVRLVYRTDGGVSVIGQNKDKSVTSKEFDRIQESDSNLKGLPFDDVDSSAILTDRRDRNYWIGKKGEGIKIDTIKRDSEEIIIEQKEKVLEDKLKALGITKEEIKSIVNE